MLKLWFVGDRGEIPLVQEENFVEYGPGTAESAVYELLDGAFCVAGESDTAWSVVYTVCDGVPVEQEIGKYRISLSRRTAVLSGWQVLWMLAILSRSRKQYGEDAR